MPIKTWILASENFDNQALTDALAGLDVNQSTLTLSDTDPASSENGKPVKRVDNAEPDGFAYKRLVIFCHGWKIGANGQHLCLTAGDAPRRTSDVTAIITVDQLAQFINELGRKEDIRSVLLAACHSGEGDIHSFASRLAVACNKIIFAPNMAISGVKAREAICAYCTTGTLFPRASLSGNWQAACNTHNTKMKKYTLANTGGDNLY